MGARTSWLVAALLGVLAGLVAVALVGQGAAGRGGGVRPSSTPARSVALDVLHDWDRSRARAWSAGDTAALDRLYVAGSSAGRADVRLLRRYVARGLVVRRMTVQVLAVRVLDVGARRIRVVVTDRLAGGVAVGRGQRLRLPGDAASSRLLVLRRDHGDWQVAAVRPGDG